MPLRNLGFSKNVDGDRLDLHLAQTSKDHGQALGVRISTQRNENRANNAVANARGPSRQRELAPNERIAWTEELTASCRDEATIARLLPAAGSLIKQDVALMSSIREIIHCQQPLHMYAYWPRPGAVESIVIIYEPVDAPNGAESFGRLDGVHRQRYTEPCLVFGAPRNTPRRACESGNGMSASPQKRFQGGQKMSGQEQGARPAPAQFIRQSEATQKMTRPDTAGGVGAKSNVSGHGTEAGSAHIAAARAAVGRRWLRATSRMPPYTRGAGARDRRHRGRTIRCAYRA